MFTGLNYGVKYLGMVQTFASESVEIADVGKKYFQNHYVNFSYKIP